MKNRSVAAASILLLLVLAAVVVGQRGRRYRFFDSDAPVDRNGVPNWEVDPQFKSDIFTFVRIRYNSYAGWKWTVDYPDSELNFSYRLQQLTSMKVHPEGIILDLTDPRLFDYPFIYIVEPGDIYFLPEEVKALRRYLENGGFLMVDDFWGEREWDNFYYAMKEVFPDREPEDVELDHEIFRCVYKLEEKPQVPSINAALGGRYSGRTWETNDSQEVHYRAIFDDNDRIMVFICHNTDLGDGWEREGENSWYFHEFSEKKAYPMGINIVTYAMTH